MRKAEGTVGESQVWVLHTRLNRICWWGWENECLDFEEFRIIAREVVLGGGEGMCGQVYIKWVAAKKRRSWVRCIQTLSHTHLHPHWILCTHRRSMHGRKVARAYMLFKQLEKKKNESFTCTNGYVLHRT